MDLVRTLAAELSAADPTPFGQPVVLEDEFVRTGLIGVKVIWDEFARVGLIDRTAVIGLAYKEARPEEHERVAFVAGYTVPEAVEAGLLPYIVEPLDTFDQWKSLGGRFAAIHDSGWPIVQLGPVKSEVRCTTFAEARKYVEELGRRMPGTENLWQIRHDG